MAMTKTHTKYILALSIIVFVLSIVLSRSVDAHDMGSHYPTLVTSQGDEAVISLLTNRIQEIKTRLSNPALAKSERHMLQKELQLVTELLSKTLSKSTGLRN